MQSPSPDTIDWISESPSPTLHHDSGNYFHSKCSFSHDHRRFFILFPAPMFNADQLMMTFPDNQLHKGLVSDPSDDLRQRISNPGCHGVLPSVDSPWSTHSQDLPGLGEVIASQFAPSQCQNTARSYFVDVSAEEPTKPSHIKPTCLFPEYNGMIDTTTTTVNGVHDPSYRRDARAMRECLMLQAADGKPLNEAFRKSAKDIVATPNTRMASSARRKYPPKYSCPIEGCSGDFTRKHNLDSAWTPMYLCPLLIIYVLQTISGLTAVLRI